MFLFQMLAAVLLWRWSDKQDEAKVDADAEVLTLLSTSESRMKRWNRFAEEWDEQ